MSPKQEKKKSTDGWTITSSRPSLQARPVLLPALGQFLSFVRDLVARLFEVV